MKALPGCALGALLAAVLAPTAAARQSPSPDIYMPQRAEIAQTAQSARLLDGQVMNEGDQPVPGALVYLRNTRTRAVKSYVAGSNGDFRFPDLPQNIDFEVWAEFNGLRSPLKTLSAFDDRREITLNLKIEGKK